jgi:hypothetical protein
MRRIIFVLGASLLIGPTASAQCGPSGPYADQAIARVRRVVTGTSALSDSVRAAYKVPAAAAADVQFVVNDSICAVAGDALRGAAGRLDLPPAMTWVIQVGPTRYWVYDPRIKSVVDIIHGVFDTAWTHLSFITG